MSAADDALAEMAANRGYKLVRSRIRTPGKGDYGRFGLKDAKSGKEMLGFGRQGLTATAGEVEAYLRGGAAAASWKSSLGAKGAKPRPRKPEPAAPPPASRPPPPARPPTVRDAKPADSKALAALIVALGYEVTAAEVRRRLAMLREAGDDVLVIEQGEILGLLTTGVTNVLHRPKPVGRITLLVIAEAARGKGLGGALIAEAERRLAARGCGLVEVTSNRKRARAHEFYEKLGFDRTSYRFVKPL